MVPQLEARCTPPSFAIILARRVAELVPPTRMGASLRAHKSYGYRPLGRYVDGSRIERFPDIAYWQV